MDIYFCPCKPSTTVWWKNTNLLIVYWVKVFKKIAITFIFRKIKIIGGKVYLRQNIAGWCQTVTSHLFVDNAKQCLPLHLKQTLPPIIWIFTEGEGNGIESSLPFKIFSTLQIIYWSKENQKIKLKSFHIFQIQSFYLRE